MPRWLALVLLLACCARGPSAPVAILGALDGREPTVRVWLRSLGEDWTSLEVTGKGGLRVTSGGFAYVTEEAVRLTREAGRPWVRVPDGTTHESVLLQPLDGVFTAAGATYAGSLHCLGGSLIHHVPLENYVLGVLRGELPLPRVPRAAAGAQAIAVRSYTLHYLTRNRPVYDVDDTTLFQRYVGLRYAPDDSSLRAGVQGTVGLYLAFEGRPLKAYYHSTCGGHTTDVPTGLDREELAPMQGVACDFCRASKYYRWTEQIEDAALLEAAELEGALRSVEVVARGPGDRALSLRVVTDRGEKSMHAGDLRLRLGASRLRSTRIASVTRVPGAVRFEGSGWGHGVGLCQMGALGMAQEGYAAEEIVAHYYPGAEIRRAY